MYRFGLRAPHPRSTTHVLIRRAKYDPPALTGPPPPKFDRENNRSLKTWAAFVSVLFKPWIKLDGGAPHDLTYDAFAAFDEGLEYDARLFRSHEAHDDIDAQETRDIAHL